MFGDWKRVHVVVKGLSTTVCHRGVVTVPISAGSWWLRRCRCLWSRNMLELVPNIKPERKPWLSLPGMSRNLFWHFLLMLCRLDSRRSRPTLTVVRSWKWQRQNTLDLLLIIFLMMNLYLLKLKIVICFQAKKHHHINCWIKSSLDYHELFSLYRRRAIHILQHDESITDYFAGPVSEVQANIINWILCEKNGILQYLQTL